MNVDEIIEYIKDMAIIDKLKLAIQVNQTAYTNTDYDKKELFNKYDNILKSIDPDYKSSFDIPKHLLMVTAWITKLSRENKIRLDCIYLILFRKNVCIFFDKFNIIWYNNK